MQRKDGFVYVLSVGYYNYYKIGVTIDLPRRLNELQAGNPRAKYVLHKWVRNKRSAEAHLHNKFKNKKKQRELFRLSKTNIAAIEKYLGTQRPIKSKKKKVSGTAQIDLGVVDPYYRQLPSGFVRKPKRGQVI